MTADYFDGASSESIFALRPFDLWAVMDDGAKAHPETPNKGLVIKIGLSSRHISTYI